MRRRRRRRLPPPPEPSVEHELRVHLRERNSAQLMRMITNMPEEDRRLIDEYGLNAYQRARDAGCGGTMQVEEWLKKDRAARQEVQLREAAWKPGELTRKSRGER